MLDGVAESWLEVAIERPTGADERTDADASGDAEAMVEEGDEADEPRTVTITGFGPRWAPPAGSPGADPA
jgi:hypothetical protein